MRNCIDPYIPLFGLRFFLSLYMDLKGPKPGMYALRRKTLRRKYFFGQGGRPKGEGEGKIS